MTRNILALLVPTALLVSPAALAQEAQSTPASAADAAPADPAPEAEGRGATVDTKVVLGLRTLALGLPLGHVAKDAKLSDLTGGLIPVWLDAGYMVTPNLMLGVYAQYAIAAGGDAWSGSGSNLRFGVQGQYHVSPAETIDPWLGLGVGYEILKMNSSIGGDASAKVKGMEFANLQAGLDFRVGSSIALGPFASFSVGQYSSGSTSDPYFGSQSGSIDHKALHHWLMFGGRAVLYL